MICMQRIHALEYPTAPTTPATISTWLASSKTTDSGDIAPFEHKLKSNEHYLPRSPEMTQLVYEMLSQIMTSQ